MVVVTRGVKDAASRAGRAATTQALAGLTECGTRRRRQSGKIGCTQAGIGVNKFPPGDPLSPIQPGHWLGVIRRFASTQQLSPAPTPYNDFDSAPTLLLARSLAARCPKRFFATGTVQPLSSIKRSVKVSPATIQERLSTDTPSPDGCLQIPFGAVHEEAVGRPAIRLPSPMLGVQAARHHPPSVPTFSTGQGQAIGIQGQAGIPHLPSQSQERKQEEARAKGCHLR